MCRQQYTLTGLSRLKAADHDHFKHVTVEICIQGQGAYQGAGFPRHIQEFQDGLFPEKVYFKGPNFGEVYFKMCFSRIYTFDALYDVVQHAVVWW